MDGAGDQGHKSHHKSSRGRKAKRRKEIDFKKRGLDLSKTQSNNFKAFTVANAGRRQRETQRKVDRAHRKHVAPAHKAEAESLYPPPVTVMVHGTQGVGKTTLIKGLVKHWTKQSLVNSKSFDGFGPINVVSGRNRRLTLFECPSNDLYSMVDLCKVSDLVLLMVNAKEGITLSTFELLNCLQTHGMPKVICILTHIDEIKDLTKVKKIKKKIKHRLWTETYDGAKLFYLSQLKNQKYLKNEINNLARFVSLAKFRPLTWKNSHSYMIADRVEDITKDEDKNVNPKCDRNVVLFGYLRGISLRASTEVHLCGVGDFNLSSIQIFPDPLPLGDKNEETDVRQRLKEKDTVLYAPMANIGAVTYDKDAMYISLPNSHFTEKKDLLYENEDLIKKRKQKKKIEDTEGVKMVKELQSGIKTTKGQKFSLFSTPTGEETKESDKSSNHSDSGSSSEESDSSSSDSESEEDEELRETVLGAVNDEYNLRLGRGLDIMEIVYGEEEDKEEEEEKSYDSEDDDENFFKPVEPIKAKEEVDSFNLNKSTTRLRKTNDNYLDSSRVNLDENSMLDWAIRDICDLFKNRFVTGDWKPLKDDDDMSDGSSISAGSFEDLEALAEQTKVEEKLLDDKIKKKEEFDAQYDEAKMDNTDKVKEQKVDYDDDYFKQHIQGAENQKSLNKSAFKDLDPETRAELEGYRPGSYVRLVLTGVSYEFIKYLSPKRPVLIGSLESTATAESVTYVKARMKKHRWFQKSVLKTNDPLVFSLGWRRFQSAPLYFIEDQNQRQRMLKYTPEHMHCNAIFLAKTTPVNTPFLCFQDVREKQSKFRIAASGVCLQMTPTSEVRKKLKLIGEPYKIKKNTCFIKKMFSSSLEVAKFEGARIQTVSGIRGVIKKAVTTNKDTGCFRATFEDKVLMSDLIFCKTWVKLEPLDLFNPIRNLLENTISLDSSDLSKNLMKTVAQIRYEKNMVVPVNKDSLYKEIKRKTRVFSQLPLPKRVEKNLPFHDRPKHKISKKKPKDYVILTDREQKVNNLIQKLNTVRKDKTLKKEMLNKKRLDLKQARERKLMEKFEQQKKEEKKRKFRAVGLRDKHKQQRFD